MNRKMETIPIISIQKISMDYTRGNNLFKAKIKQKMIIEGFDTLGTVKS